jgi:hypothetical protein
MSTTSEPAVDDDSYPASWTPRHIVERDDALEPLAIEKHLAALSPRELTLMLQRVRVMR